MGAGAGGRGRGSGRARRAGAGRAAGGAPAAGAPRVVVVGGTGFVGRRVVSELKRAGADVTAASRTAPSAGVLPADVSHLPVDLLAGGDLGALAGFDTVVSCVGVIGGEDADAVAGNGEANERAVEAAAAGGASRFVYVSVDSAVRDSGVQALGVAGLKGYFEGKARAEAAVTAAFPGDDSVIVCPSFVYGGDAFEFTPPRVPDAYGSAVEGLLSAGPLPKIAEKLPGPLKLVLAPPVKADNLAKCVAAGALRRDGVGQRVEGTSAINRAAKRLFGE